MTAAQAISAAGDLAGEVLQELEVGYTIKLIISRDRLKIFLRVEIDEPGHLCPPERVTKFVTDSRVFLTADEKKRLPVLGAAVTVQGRTLIAQHDGGVQRVGGKLTVSKLYEVDGNVDFKVGNVDFDGRVTIKGDVLPGFNVKATGDVAITGMVENASIEAGQ